MRSTLPIDVLHAIRLSTWHSLFAARGYPAGITAATDSLDAIVDALRTADLPVALARALFTIAAFATEAGRIDLYDAADALAHEARWPQATSPADLVALLLADAAADSEGTRALLEAAQILRDRHFRPYATHIYVGCSRAADADVGVPTQYVDAWRTHFAAWARTRDFGEVLSVLARADAGTLHYEIVHQDRATTRLVAVPTAITASGASRFTSSAVRPLRAHQITYDRSTRRLSVTTDCMEAVTPLATIAGAVLFDDPRHFFEEQAIALWPLQELGPAALVVPELSAKLTVSAVGGTWHSGKNHAITPRGRDFFKALERYKIRIEGGRLDLVTLRGDAVSNGDPGAPTHGDIVLRPPHLLTISEPELAPLFGQFLDHARMTSPPLRLSDFFSLQPWVQAAAGWTASEGEGAFAELVASGLLKPDPANRTVASKRHPHAGRTATAYRLRGNQFIAWSPDPTIAPFVVREEDLVVYALSFAKLATVVAEAIGLAGAASALDDDGLLYCGRRVLGPTHVLVFLLTRPIRPATVERLREAAEHGHAVLITPEGRMQSQGLRQVAMPKLVGPWRPLLGAIVRAIKVESFVDTTIYAPVDARIVLHRATMRVWVDGVLCSTLTEIHFRLLEMLITHAGQMVHTKDIAEHVAQGRGHEDTTRKAVESLMPAIDKCFKAKKLRTPKDLKSMISQPRHGHYALNAKGFVD